MSLAELDVYPWQRDEWQSLVRLIGLGRLPHALMLAGPAEIGKQNFALKLSQLLLCATPSERSCGNCKACKLFSAATHPDFMLVEPEAEGKIIKVDQVRELAEFATRTAAMGGRRVIVVSPGEAMNQNAANAFLKTLEEPGKDVIMVVVVHQPGRILPTIRSRCRIFPFALPSRDLVAAWLKAGNTSSRDLDQIMSLSGGRPLRGRRLLDSGLWDQLQLFKTTLDAVTGNRLQALDAAKTLQGLAPGDALEWFQYLVYENLKIASLDGRQNMALLFRFMDRLNDVKQRLMSTANPNPQLVWEEVLMDWKSVIDLQHNRV
ncbi:MAG: DNA polymerase III subunit delta' [Porticoccaceae bacterium]